VGENMYVIFYTPLCPSSQIILKEKRVPAIVDAVSACNLERQYSHKFCSTELGYKLHDEVKT